MIRGCLIEAILELSLVDIVLLLSYLRYGKFDLGYVNSSLHLQNDNKKKYATWSQNEVCLLNTGENNYKARITILWDFRIDNYLGNR